MESNFLKLAGESLHEKDVDEREPGTKQVASSSGRDAMNAANLHILAIYVNDYNDRDWKFLLIPVVQVIQEGGPSLKELLELYVQKSIPEEYRSKFSSQTSQLGLEMHAKKTAGGSIEFDCLIGNLREFNKLVQQAPISEGAETEGEWFHSIYTALQRSTLRIEL